MAFFKAESTMIWRLRRLLCEIAVLVVFCANWCAYKQTATQKTPLLQLQRMLPFLGQLSSASVISLNFWEDPWILNQKIRTEATQYQPEHVFVYKLVCLNIWPCEYRIICKTSLTYPTSIPSRCIMVHRIHEYQWGLFSSVHQAAGFKTF